MISNQPPIGERRCPVCQKPVRPDPRRATAFKAGGHTLVLLHDACATSLGQEIDKQNSPPRQAAPVRKSKPSNTCALCHKPIAGTKLAHTECLAEYAVVDAMNEYARKEGAR